MAAIEYLESTPVTTEQSHTGDTTWTDVHADAEIAAGAFTGSKNYFVQVSARLRGSSIADVFGIRLVHGTTPTVFTSSVFSIEPFGTVTPYVYSWFTVFAQPATAEIIKVQMATLQDSAETVFVDEVRIVAINLTDDLTEDTGSGGDWKFVEDASGPTTHTTTAFGSGQTDRAPCIFTPPTAGDDWGVWSRAQIGIEDTAINYEIGLLDESDTLVRKPITHEGEDNLEIRSHMIPYVAEGLSAASHTFQIQTRDDASPLNKYESAAVFVLNLDKFESHDAVHNAGVFNNTVTGTFEELATLGTYSPATTGDHLVIADALMDPAFDRKMRLQFAGTSDPPGWDALIVWERWDATDEGNAPVFVIRSIPSSGETIDLDGSSSNITHDWEDRIILAFSMELAPVAGVGKIIIQNAA